MAGFGDSWAGVDLSGVLGRSIVVQNVTVTNPANFDAMLDEVTRKADSVAAARGSIAPSGGASLSSQPVPSRALIGKNLIGTFGMAYGGRP